MDYSAVLFDPVYAAIGVPAMMTITSGVVDITVIDHTRGTSNTSGRNVSGFTGLLEIRSVEPQAFARVPELIEKGVDRSEYDGSLLAFNDSIWVIRSHEMRGSPNGENKGEVQFFLKKSND